jgi:hypothetical protein
LFEYADSVTMATVIEFFVFWRVFSHSSAETAQISMCIASTLYI